jgi:hypothetical protein
MGISLDPPPHSSPARSGDLRIPAHFETSWSDQGDAHINKCRCEPSFLEQPILRQEQSESIEYSRPANYSGHILCIISLAVFAIHSHNITTFTFFKFTRLNFTQMAHEGCTQLLSPIILLWIIWAQLLVDSAIAVMVDFWSICEKLIVLCILKNSIRSANRNADGGSHIFFTDPRTFEGPQLH